MLSQAKAERAARHGERQRQRAAATVCRWWRGASARSKQRARLRTAWVAEYGPLVAQTQDLPPAAQLVTSVLPPVLAAHLPGPCQQEQRAALAGGAPLPPAQRGDTTALRGCFALLLRSLAASDARLNLLGLGLTEWEAGSGGAAAQGFPDSAKGRRALLLSQLQRLLLLCCSLLGSGSSSSSKGGKGSSVAAGGAVADPLLQAAAGRLVGLLSDASLWKCFRQGQAEHAEERRRLQQRLHGWLAPLPLLRMAALRLVAALSPAPVEQGTSAAQRPGRQQLTAVLNGLVVAQLALWRQQAQQQQSQQKQQQPVDAAGSGSAVWGSPCEGAGQQLLLLLATPGLLPLLTPATVAQLTGAPGFAALLGAATSWQPSNDGSSNALGLLGMLAQLAAGKRASQQQGQQGRQVDFLPPSQLLQQPGVASALSAAAAALLQSALDTPSSSSSSSAAAFEELWPFAEGTFAGQLLSALPLPQFASLYHRLLLLADACSGSTRAGVGGGAAASSRAAAARLLSALAFGTQLLPRLWRELATSIGLPLEAPLQASPCCFIFLRQLSRPCIVPPLANGLGFRLRPWHA